MSQLGTDDLIFVDETGINIAMTRRDARAPKGERAHAATPVNKGQNMTVLGVLSLPGITAAMTIEGSTATQVLLTFGQTVLGPVLRPGQIVIMDNLSSHKVKGRKEAIASAGATREYLPSYSPDVSLIEGCWSKFKEYLRAKAAQTREVLDQAITEAFDMITPQNARGWFAHCGYM